MVGAKVGMTAKESQKVQKRLDTLKTKHDEVQRFASTSSSLLRNSSSPSLSPLIIPSDIPPSSSPSVSSSILFLDDEEEEAKNIPLKKRRLSQDRYLAIHDIDTLTDMDIANAHSTHSTRSSKGKGRQ